MSESEQASLHAARQFADKYKAAESEKQLGQSFWRDFFTSVAGISDLLTAGIEFEFPVRSKSGTINFIDVFWSGVVLIEQKSAGKSLDEAEKQARDYLIALQPEHRPPTLIVSDFKRIRIVEILAGQTYEFEVKDLPENLHRMEMVVGLNAKEATRQEITADQKAVELMANLYVEFEKAGYEGHEVSVLLVRTLFLNFGDDTRMWKQVPGGLFGAYIGATASDGSGVGGRLQELFQILDSPIEKRPSTLSPRLVDFPYINGGLFKEQLPIFAFTAAMREALVKTAEYDWSKISPAIFGSMFQTVKSKDERRSLGEHYTSEANILKVIRPLFLDDFTEKLQRAWGSVSNLKRLQAELASKNYLDPACGSGNFLVVTYRRLRNLELKLVARLQDLQGKVGDVYLDGRMGLSVTLSQFHGIEINEWSSQIATVAMYLADHQANLEMEEITGISPNRFPLTQSANIQHQNALLVDWTSVCEISENTFIMGNPPFLGSLMMTPEQREDTKVIWNNHKKTGLVDFVTNWFIIAGRLVSTLGCEAAFVSTNSITQGEQPSLLWGELTPLGVEISFAHKTFSWTNEAKGKAAVHVVIIGLTSRATAKKKALWIYSTPKAEPELHWAENINAYLIDASDVIIGTRQSALSPDLPPMFFGSMPRDNGHLSKINAEEAEEIRNSDPVAALYLRQLIGAAELINGVERYCLWLEDAEPGHLRTSTVLKRRVELVREMRLASAASSTRQAASVSHLFVQRAQPNSEYIAVPSVSSESRPYVPMGFFPPSVIANNALLTIPNANLAVFAILMSKPFNTWNRAISGRLKSDMRISQEITYNNFPLRQLTLEEKETLKKSGKAILDARQIYKTATLADLYGLGSTPLELLKTHQENDRLVLKVFGLKSSASEEQILSKLFSEYETLTSGLIPISGVRR